MNKGILIIPYATDNGTHSVICRFFCVQSQQDGKKKRRGRCACVNITVNLHLKEM